MERTSIRRLTEADRTAGLALATAGGLRPEGILAANSSYWGAFAAGRMIGLIGCEYEGQYALLRSAVVDEAWRSKGIGARLTRKVLQEARSAKLAAVYLFSTDAGPYWTRLGFQPAPVSELVSSLPNAPQVQLFARIGWLPTEVAFKMDMRK